MNVLAVDLSGIEELITIENIRFLIQIVSLVVMAAAFIYKSGEVAVEKYKRKKAEREKDEAYVALNQAQKTMVNVLDGMAMLVNSSTNVDDTAKINFNSVVLRQADIIKESNSLLEPIINGMKADFKDKFNEFKEDAADIALGIGASLGETVLDKYMNNKETPDV